MTNSIFKVLPLLALAMALGACSSSPRLGSNVEYGDTKAVEGITNEFGSTDLQMIAEAMTNSLLQSPVITQSPQRPMLTLADVKNKTSEYIDTRAITEKIRLQLMKSGAVKFNVSVSEMKNQTDELMRQNNSGLYKSQSTSKIGNMIGSQYRLEGSISSIDKRGDGMHDVFYIFTMSLVNNETGVLEWADEKEIRKTSGR